MGRAFVDEALSRGAEVVVFNRGTHPAPAGVSVLRGDRTARDGLSALEQGRWDVVVDTWSWAPAAVRRAADLLAVRVEHYVYVSSRSVYRFPIPPDADERAPLVEGDPDDEEVVDYARAKAGGELAAAAAFGERALLVRAGLILGPHENIGRLPWWLQRIARGGDVVAPGPPELGLQYIDARDLATWGLTAAVRGVGGPFNTVSPPGYTTMGQLLQTCVDVTDSDARLRWVDAEVIVAAGGRTVERTPDLGAARPVVGRTALGRRGCGGRADLPSDVRDCRRHVGVASGNWRPTPAASRPTGRRPVPRGRGAALGNIARPTTRGSTLGCWGHRRKSADLHWGLSQRRRRIA